MTTGLDYQGFVKQIATLAVVEPDDPNFLTIIPQAITYAENRICRELDFLFSSVSTTAYTLTPGSRTITLPAGLFVVPESINVITPQNATGPDNGVRVPLTPTTREVLDSICGVSSDVGVPQYFAPIGNKDGALTFLVGPYPDASYGLEIVGTIRPDSLSEKNTTTYISRFMPDIMVAAAMIYISGYQRNFGATQANDPQMPISWETQYKTLLVGAAGEEFRKKYEAAAWTSKTPSPLASPTRG